MKTKQRNTHKKNKLSLYAALVLFLFIHYVVFPAPCALGEDLPSNPLVQAGDPTITSNGTDMTVNAGAYDKTWIDWQGGFNIAAGNSVNNLGPSSAAVILHNDVTGMISDIQGALNGNCNVFLLNPSGIIFGQGAQVNVGGLVVSTLNMSMDDFMSGDYKFKDVNPSLIVNSGEINATGPMGVSLISGAIRNEGVINANLSTVNLVTGSEVTLNINNEGSIQVAVNKEVLSNVYDKDGNRVSIGVDNVGDINANGGQVYIEAEAANDIFSTLINQSGVVKAGSMVEKDGKIILVSNSEGIVQNTGTLDASAIEAGATGGEIKVLGDNVRLFGDALVDASGDAGGGTVLIGGSFQGKGPERASSLTVVGKDVNINADAGTTGNGGNVVVWSDNSTYYVGNISAKGGEQSGNGGSVEVSGKQNLGFYGHVDAAAANGQVGSLLLDPTNIIVHSHEDGAQPDTGLPTILSGDGGAVDYHINEMTLEDYVTASITLEATNNITFNAINDVGNVDHLFDIGRSNGYATSLTINAGGAFSMNSSDTIGAHGISITAASMSIGGLTITGTAAGITLISSGAVDINNTIATNGGTFNSSGTTFDNTGGAITTSGGIVTISQSGAVTVGANITSTNAAISIATTASDIRITQSAGTTIDAGASTVTLRSDDMTLGGTSITGNGGIYIYTRDADTIIQLGDDAEAIGGQLELNTAMLQTLSSTGTVTIGEDGVNTGRIELGSSAIDLSGETFSLTLATEGAIDDIKGTSSVLTLANGEILTLNANTTIGATNAVNTAATIINADANTGATLRITNTGDITDLQLNADSGTITFNNTGSINTGAAMTANVINLTSSGTMTIDQNVTADTGAMTLIVNADNGAFNQTAGIISSTAGTLTIEADDMALSSTITATGQNVILRSYTAADAIDLGTNGAIAGTLELSDAELDTITATTLRIGDTDAGAITITEDISPANITNLTLITVAGVSQQVGDTITVSSLKIDADTAVTLNESNNDVTTLAVTTGNVGATFSFADIDDLTIGTVDGTSGIIRAQANITVDAAGALSVTPGVQVSITGDATGNTISLEGSSVTLGAGGGTGSETVFTDAGAGSGNIAISAASADITLGQYAISANTGLVTLAAQNGEILAASATGIYEIWADGNVIMTAVGIGSDTNNVEISGDGIADNTLTITSTAINGGDIDITELAAQYSTINLTIGDADVSVDISLAGANDEIDINGSTDTLTLYSLDGQDSNRSFSVNLTEDTKTMALRDIYTDSGTVTLVASGPVTDAGTTEITATTASITAKGGIGSADALETAVTNLSLINNDVVGSTSNILITNESGVTATTLNGATNYDGGNITIVALSPLTVAADVITSGNGAITLTATDDGGVDDILAVNANVTIMSDQGDIQLNAGQDITLAAGVLVQTGGNGTIDFNADIDGNLQNGDITMNATSLIQTTGTGAITLDADDDLTITNITSAGAITINSTDGGAGAITLNGLVGNTNGTVTFSDPVTLIGASTVSSTNGNVTFSSIDGALALTVNTSNGTATFGAVGGTTPLAGLTVNASTASLGGNISTDNDTNVNFTGTNIINLTANVTIDTDAVGAATNGGDVLFKTTGTITGAFDLNIDTTEDGAGTPGSVQIATVDTLSLDINNDGTTTLYGNITADDDVSLDGATDVNLAANVTILGDGSTNVLLTGGDVAGDFNLTVDAGTGAVTLGLAAGAIDIDVNKLTVTATGITSINSDLRTDEGMDFGNATDVNIVAGVTLYNTDSGTIDLSGGDVDAAGALTINASATDVKLGVLDVNAATTLNIDSTGTTTIMGNITTAGGAVALDGATNVVLGADIAINTTNGAAAGANIDFVGVAGANSLSGAFDLSLTAGTGGVVSFDNADGVMNITVVSADEVSFDGDLNIDGNLMITADDSIAVTVTTGSVNAAGNIDFSVTDTVDAALIDINGAVIASGNIELDADGTSVDSTVDVDAALTAGGTLTITSDVSVGGNTASVDIAGGTAQAAGNINITSDDSISINSMVDSTGGTTSIGSDNNLGTVTINAVTRGTTVTLDAGDGAGIITITADPNNTRGAIAVNAVSAFNLNANFSALTNITVTPATVLGANSTVTSTSGNVTFTEAITDTADPVFRTLTVSAVNGIASFNTTAGTDIIGTNANRVGAVTVSAATVNLDGAIYTDNDSNVDFTGTNIINLTANVTIDTDAVGAATNGGDVLFKTTGTITGAFDLNIDTTEDGAGTPGSVQIATVDTLSLDINNDGTTTLYGNITADDDVSLDGATDVNLAANVTILGDGSTNVLLTGGDVAGDFNLTVDAGTGAVTLGLAAGQTEIDVNKLTVTTTGQTNIAGNILADEGIDLSNATNVDITTDVTLTNTDSGIIDLTGGIDGAFDLTITANATDVKLGIVGANASLGTAAAGHTALTVTSTGTTTLMGNITTTTTNGVSFTGATNVILGADVTIDTGATTGDVLFSNAGANSLSGEFDLRIDAGTGNVTFDNATQLTSLAVDADAATDVDNGATNITLNGVINIPGSVRLFGVGIADVNGALTATGGINVAMAGDVQVDANVITSGGSTITIIADSDVSSAGDVTIGTAADAIVQGVDGLITISGQAVTLGGVGTGNDGRVLTIGEGAIDIDTVGAFTIANTTADNSAIVAGGNITVDSSTSTITTTGVIQSTSGSVALTAADDITIGGVVSADGDNGTVSITKSGAGVYNIITSAAINTHGANGTITIINNGASSSNITIGGAITTVSGSVSITTTAGLVTLDSAITTGGTGAITVTADGEGYIAIHAGITTNSGNVSLQADDDVILDNAASDITTISGSIDIDAGLGAASGAVTMIKDSKIQTSEGNININSDDVITLGQLVATVGSAAITSTVSTIISADDATVEITAPTVDLNAVTGIGAAGASALDLSTTTTITADLSGGAGGNIYIDNAATGAVTVSTMTISGGAGLIDYEQTGNQKLTLTTVTTSDGNITINNTGGTGADILVGAVTADITNDTITINATGSIDDDASDATADITSDIINLDAVEGIGATRALELASVRLMTVDTTNGNIDIDNVANEGVTVTTMTTGTGNITYDQTGAQTLGIALAQVTNGDISISNNSTINLVDVNGDTTDGVVTLTATGAALTTTNAASVVTAYTLTIVTATTVGTDAGADNAVDAGWFDVDVTNLNITTAAATYIDESDDINLLDVTTTGTLGVDAAGTLTVTKISSAGQAVALTTTTNIIDGGEANQDVTASSLRMTAGTGIGDSSSTYKELETTISTLAARTTTGDINVANTGTLAIGTLNAVTGVTIVTGGANDHIAVTASSPLSIDSAVSNAGTGDITLAAEGTAATDDLTIGADITAGGGNIYLYAGHDVLQTVGDVLAAGAGNISVYAGTDYNGGSSNIKAGNADGDVTQSTGRDMTTATGTITIKATENVAVSILSTGGNVSITADDDTYLLANSSGAITDNLAAETANITAATATLRAATGIGSADDIETNITTLDALNTTSGNIVIYEVAAGVNLDINRATQQSPGGAENDGNIDIRTENGILTVVADQYGVTAVDDGTITLYAGDSVATYTEDLIINDSIIANRGKVTLTSQGDDVTFSADGDVTTTSGEIEVNAVSGLGAGLGIITMSNGTVLNAGDDIIDLNAYGDITLGSLVTTSSSAVVGSEAVNINSAAGAIVDGGDTDVDIVANTIGALVVIDAVTGVGSGGAIDTTVASIDIDNSTGNIQINETDAITVVKAVEAVSGNINITAAGTITADSSGAPVNVISTLLAGTITLDANGTASDVIINDGLSTATGIITITADNDVIFAAEGDITSTTGNISVTADANSDQDGTGGALTMANGTLINSGTGTIALSADEDITLGGLLTTAGSGTVITITSTSGAVIDGGDAHTDIAANTAGAVVTIDAVTGVGTINALDIEVDTIDIDCTTSGDIRIIELNGTGDDGLVVQHTHFDNPSGPNDGDIDIATTTGLLTISGTVSTAMKGTITLFGDGAAVGDLIVNSTVTSVEGNILLKADNDVTFGAGGDITSTTGNVTVTADADNGGAASGALTMADGTLINAGSGTIALNADEDITLGGLLTTSTSNTAVVLTTTEGGIVDGGDTYVDVVAADGRLVIDAVIGVGSAGAIETTVASIDVDNTTGGNIDINETNAITVIQLDQDAAAGTVNLDAGGTITIAATADSGVGVSSLAGQIELDATGATSDILVYNTITTTSGAINILADNDIIFTIVGDVTSTSGNITITADADATADAGQGGAITMADNNDPIAAVADSTVIDAGSGLIALNADEDITIGRLVTTHNVAGDTEIRIISISGALVDAGNSGNAALNQPDIEVDTTNGTVSISTLTGIGTDANAIETKVRELAATTTSGDINIDNSSASLLTIVNATGYAPAGVNGVTITGGSSSDNITVTSTSPLTVSAVVTNTGGGAVVLAAEGTAATVDLTIASAISAAGGNGNISLYAGHDILQTTGDVTAAGTGAVNVYAGVDYNNGTAQAGHATGDITQTSGRTISSTSGNITMTATENVNLSAVSTTGNVSITADDNTYALKDNSGAITDNLAAETANITAATATLRTATGIGSADDIETNITTLDALNTTSGNIVIYEVAAGTNLNVNQATQQTAGNIDIRTENGTLTIVADQSGVTAVGAGTITLIAGDSDTTYAEDLVINDTVTSASGLITLTSSGDDVRFGAGGDVTTTSGLVDVNAESGVGLGEGVIFMADGAVINSGSAQTTMNAYGDITLGGVTTTFAAADAIVINSAAGGIVDGGDADIDITANSVGAIVNLDAVTGIGSGNALETKIASLEAKNTTTGNIKINETDAITLKEIINQAVGSVDVTAGGTITTTVVTADHGAVNLYATAGDLLDTAGGLITATAESTLKASGVVGTNANPIDVNIDGKLWILAGSMQDEVSANIAGTVNGGDATERVEILLPAPPGLVILDNHLMGGGSYGSGSSNGTILSRGYGYMAIMRADMFSSVYQQGLQPWGHNMMLPWVLSEGSVIGDDFLSSLPAVIDVSQLNLPVISGMNQTANFYIIRSLK